MSPHLASLELTAPSPERKCLHVKPVGRPSRKTGSAAIAKVERISRILQARSAGMTFKQIGVMHGVTTQAIHKAFWKAMRSYPFDPARLRRRAMIAARLANMSEGERTDLSSIELMSQPATG
jgi:hypothetical protein